MKALPPDLFELLRGIPSMGVISGAGVSAESGIPTYRGVGGIYEDPEKGERTVEALSGPCLARDPDRTWRAIADLARAAQGAKPNAAHFALVDMERKLDRFVLLTQNVDGLHQEAGSQNVIDIHGNVADTFCQDCGKPGTLTRETVRTLQAAPRCELCNGVLRPDAVLFEEMLPTEKIERIYAEFHENPPEVVLSTGTSAIFPYISAPIIVARSLGRTTIEVDPCETALSDTVHFSLRGSASVYLPLIAQAL